MIGLGSRDARRTAPRLDNRSSGAARREGGKRPRGPMQGIAPPQCPGEISPRALSCARDERTVRLR